MSAEPLVVTVTLTIHEKHTDVAVTQDESRVLPPSAIARMLRGLAETIEKTG